MNHDHDQNDTSGQGGIDQETERRNRENETGEQSQQPQSGQQQSPQSGQPGQQSGTPTTGQAQAGQSQSGSDGETESGFVGSSGDQSSDYLTKGESQDFAPEGQGATDTDPGTSDIETGQTNTIDSTLDDGSDTSR